MQPPGHAAEGTYVLENQDSSWRGRTGCSARPFRAGTGARPALQPGTMAAARTCGSGRDPVRLSVARKSKKPGRAAARALGRAAMGLAVLIGWRRAGLAALIVLGPIVCINLLVAFCGSTVIFPLSPRHLGDKLSALGRYAAHRPRCFEDSHPALGPVVARVEARHRIPAGLLAALVQVESAGRPHRISPAGAMGQGQLAPSTARALGVQDPFDTLENIEASGRYLAQQLARFGEIRLAVAAYNAGPGAVAGARSVPHNGETEVYVERVLRLHRAALALAARERARAVAVAARPRGAEAGPLSDRAAGPVMPAPSDEDLNATSPGAEGSRPPSGSARARARWAVPPGGTNSSTAQKAVERKLNQKARRKRRASRPISPREPAAPVPSEPSDRLTLPRLAERAAP